MSQANLKITRRHFLAGAGAGLAAAAMVPSGMSRAFAATPKLAVPTVTYGTDAGLGPYLSPWFKTFNKEYSNAHAALALLASYYPDIEARLAAGGKGIDACFTDPGYAETWYQNGWIRALDGFPGLAQVNADVLPQSLLPDMFATDGKQIGIPYYNGTQIFAYNEQLLHKVSPTVPTTWAEVTSLCAELKKAGVESPMLAFWDKDFNTIVYVFMAYCASQGMTSAFDKSAHNLPTLQNSPVAEEVLNLWVSWYKKGYVTADVLSATSTINAGIFAAGKSAFSVTTTQWIKPWQTTAGNASHGVTKVALIPGTTHKTQTDVDGYHITSWSPNASEAWELIKYLAWRNPQAGNHYTVPTGYLLADFGLTAPYKGLLESPAVPAAMSYLDYSVYKTQLAQAVNLFYPADRQPWFAGWMTTMASSLQSAIIGQSSIKSGTCLGDRVRKGPSQGVKYANLRLAGWGPGALRPW